MHNELKRLERLLITMGNMVESLLADSVMALVEGSPPLMPGIRREDCKAHEQWLEADKLCLELLASGKLEPAQVRFVWAADKIATALKRTADESLRIGESLCSCADSSPTAGALSATPRMATLTQSMLSDALEALVNRDAVEAAALHLVSRELASLNGQATRELTEGLAGGRIAVPLGAACLGAAQRLARIGDEALEISNQVSRLYRHNQTA